MLIKTIQERTLKKCKLGTKDPKPFKKILQKRAYLAISSKLLVISRILLQFVVYLVTTLQQEIFNSFISKYKSKTTLIIHIIEVSIKTFQYNIRQTKQIEDNLSSFKRKIRHQSLEVNILDLLLERNYLLINRFQDIFRDEASIKRLYMCKNVDV